MYLFATSVALLAILSRPHPALGGVLKPRQDSPNVNAVTLDVVNAQLAPDGFGH
ncbi:hypothetical protein MPER_01018, partial [Moniliophthora perniciosa FA553]